MLSADELLMVHCDRCGGYVSRDYVRVFGDNHDCVASCPNCRAGWTDGEGQSEERSERKLTFRMSEFDASERVPSNGESGGPVPESVGGRFGRVGRAVSGLF